MKTVLCFLGLSLTAWIWMAVEYIKQSRYKAKAKQETVMAVGIIIDYVKKQRNWGRSIVNAYYPVISFSAASKEYKVQPDYSYPELSNFSAERPPVGSEIVLYYNPSNPAEIHLQADERNNSRGHYKLGWYIMAFSAVLSLLCALILKW